MADEKTPPPGAVALFDDDKVANLLRTQADRVQNLVGPWEEAESQATEIAVPELLQRIDAIIDGIDQARGQLVQGRAVLADILDRRAKRGGSA